MKCFEQSDNYKIADKLLKMVDYSGVDVLEVAMYALTDMNFHKESDVVRQMIKNNENDFLVPYKSNILEDELK